MLNFFTSQNVFIVRAYAVVYNFNIVTRTKRFPIFGTASGFLIKFKNEHGGFQLWRMIINALIPRATAPWVMTRNIAAIIVKMLRIRTL